MPTNELMCLISTFDFKEYHFAISIMKHIVKAKHKGSYNNLLSYKFSFALIYSAFYIGLLLK